MPAMVIEAVTSLPILTEPAMFGEDLRQVVGHLGLKVRQTRRPSVGVYNVAPQVDHARTSDRVIWLSFEALRPSLRRTH